jgi:hypothetical protein
VTTRCIAPRPALGALAVALACAAARADPGRAPLRLDRPARERLGLSVVAVQSTKLAPAIRGYGRLLDPTVLVAAIYERQAAQGALEAADLEYRRVQTLHQGNANASARDLEAARATFEREWANARNAEARLAAVWGGSAGRHGDLTALAAKLVAREAAVARLDLPLGTVLAAAPATARVAAAADASTPPVAATPLGTAPDTDPTVQGRGFLLLLEPSPWPPGTLLEGWLTPSGEPQTGFEVPRSALLRDAGRTCVYVQTAEDAFARRVVQLDHPTAAGWFVTSGLAAGERLVVRGAQALLSADASGAADSEDAD